MSCFHIQPNHRLRIGLAQVEAPVVKFHRQAVNFRDFALRATFFFNPLQHFICIFDLTVNFPRTGIVFHAFLHQFRQGLARLRQQFAPAAKESFRCRNRKNHKSSDGHSFPRHKWHFPPASSP